MLSLCWTFCYCCPWVQVIGGSAQAWRPLLSPLSSKSPQQHIPRRGSPRTQKISLPSLWTQDLLVLYLSVRGGGPSAHLSPGRPPSPQASLLHREQVLLSASSVLSWCSGLRQGGLSQGRSLYGRSATLTWLGTATLLAPRGRLGCRLSRAESQALSTGVTTRPQVSARLAGSGSGGAA